MNFEKTVKVMVSKHRNENNDMKWMVQGRVALVTGAILFFPYSTKLPR
ncbi:hypothetical protein [Neobacillus drentensis]